MSSQMNTWLNWQVFNNSNIPRRCPWKSLGSLSIRFSGRVCVNSLHKVVSDKLLLKPKLNPSLTNLKSRNTDGEISRTNSSNVFDGCFNIGFIFRLFLAVPQRKHVL